MSLFGISKQREADIKEVEERENRFYTRLAVGHKAKQEEDRTKLKHEQFSQAIKDASNIVNILVNEQHNESSAANNETNKLRSILNNLVRVIIENDVTTSGASLVGCDDE